MSHTNAIQRIKELVLTDDRSADLYAITNTTIRQYNLHNQQFNEELIRLDNQLISKVAVYGSLALFVTAEYQLYLQVLPNKLQDTNGSNNGNTHKNSSSINNKSKESVEQIDKYLIHKLAAQPIIYLAPLNQ